jgi:pimeloyl-ACP methyl ester carboxylesterase
MPTFRSSAGVDLNYDTVGDPAAPALMLIHGSTLTGTHDFAVLSDIAQRFARDHFVVLPDCEGHGRSGVRRRDVLVNGTTLRYSFSDMARGLAELLQGIGASPAFVAGHSNGGNVALFMAKEQPQHVRAAVLLAANAYIDDHVRSRVPIGMNPDRVERESVDWMREMIMLHDAHQGEGYWRELLLATITETISTPDWQAADLASVTTRCLCIQGENDSVNAPGRHAQTMAQWLPNAELWVPAGIGHSVHHEIPDEFELRLRAFFAHGVA